MKYQGIENVKVVTKFLVDLFETSIEYCKPKDAKNVLDIQLTPINDGSRYRYVITYIYE